MSESNQVKWRAQIPATAGTNTTGQVSVLSTATIIVNALQTRHGILIINHGDTDMFLGTTNGVTITTGLLLKARQSIEISGYDGAIYGIVQTTPVTVSYWEMAE